MIISRRNYDVGQGVDLHGNFMSGVFEQSWRVGGASGAEIVAMEAFKEDPTLLVVWASTYRLFGTNCPTPDGAIVHFEGVDPVLGPMKECTTITKSGFSFELGCSHEKVVKAKTSREKKRNGDERYKKEADTLFLPSDELPLCN